MIDSTATLERDTRAAGLLLEVNSKRPTRYSKADLVEAHETIQRLGQSTDEAPVKYWKKVTD